mmetsp:Transcript_8780/g.26986  ORF Transcript_8780/g.26986 Transcript_8780/m.26986 type:complete len:83 (+) Transcript_8780:97-345(+)
MRGANSIQRARRQVASNEAPRKSKLHTTTIERQEGATFEEHTASATATDREKLSAGHLVYVLASEEANMGEDKHGLLPRGSE